MRWLRRVRATLRAGAHANRRGPWRLGAVAAFLLAGGLFVASALSSHGLDLRAASVTDLDSVVRQESAHAHALQHQVADLKGDVDRLAHGVRGGRVGRLQQRVDRLSGPAGFRPVDGPGVTVRLDDAPKAEIDRVVESGTLTADALLVHQQDIQAVVNALWHGGARAISLQGQRVVSTTGIKCVGNTVVLHGVPYSPPYVISAVGNPATLRAGLRNNAYIAAYQTFVHRFRLGWDLTTEPTLHVPGYSGTAGLRYAEPLGR
ncbi:MAG: DUF881 domain-containing protein [Marmoricola sp.]